VPSTVIFYFSLWPYVDGYIPYSSGWQLLIFHAVSIIQLSRNATEMFFHHLNMYVLAMHSPEKEVLMASYEYGIELRENKHNFPAS
jgi:hypothetical protein